MNIIEIKYFCKIIMFHSGRSSKLSYRIKKKKITELQKYNVFPIRHSFTIFNSKFFLNESFIIN